MPDTRAVRRDTAGRTRAAAAVLTGVALLCYLLVLYTRPGPVHRSGR